jgi:chemosensory pili system protein ChpA (sensor histidine kinase/response regulator)
MKLQDDFTTLNWVKGELDETLKQARQALEAYVDDPADSSLMSFCATYLHQAQGTLRMVELYGAAMVIEEMERLAEALLADSVKQRDEAYSVLMRGMVQLPDYLERVQSGHKDIPIVLLPLLNDLRACRGEKLLTDSVLFAPDLSIALPASAKGLPAPLAPADLRAQTLRLRLAFQAALLKWIRESDSAQHPQRLRDVLDRLRSAVSAGEEPRRLFWIAAGVADAVGDGSLEASAAVKLLFGRVDREIRHFAEEGEEGMQLAPPRELVKNLLYYIAHSTSTTSRVNEIRDTYRLGSLLPTDEEIEHAKGSISGHNRTLLDTVSIAIKDDLLRVKEALDIFLRAQNRDTGDLLAQVDLLDRVRDTLGMLGLGIPRRVVTEQRGIIEDIASGRREADEGSLLDVAGALLYVEASLDDHIERLGAVGEISEDEALELPKAEVRKILDALMREAAVNIQQAKHDIIAFIESPWDHERVEQIPRLLEEISGALRMLDLGEASALMTGIVRFVEVELQRHRRVPTAEQMDKLADALASIEYYLEATREQRGGRQKILDVTRDSLESLGYWPVPTDDGDGPDGGESLSPVSPQNDAELFSAAASLAYGHEPSAPTSNTISRGLSSFNDEPAAQEQEFPSWGEHLPIESAAAFRAEQDNGEIAIDESMTLDFSSIEPLELTIDEEPALPTDQPEELDSAVEIAPGADLHDLIVGEAGEVQQDEHDISGLRLTETTHDQPAAVTEVAVPVVAPTPPRWIEIEEEIEEEVVDETAADSSFQMTSSNDIDDEIRDVFIEEVQEEIDNLSALLPQWKANPEDVELIKPIRRSFHTLKGSGRLVGAMALGEFSWKVENMLNRVLDRTVGATAQIVALVEHAINALPGLLRALRGEGAPDSDIAGIMDTADKLAAGELLWLPPRKPATRIVKRIIKRRVLVDPTPDPTPEIAVDSEPVPVSIETPDTEVTAGPLPGLDPVLFDILKSETAMHLGVVDDYLAEAKQTPLPVTEPLLRATHTLSGAIAMVEINELSQLLSPLEGYLKRLRAIATPVDADGLDVLAKSAETVREVMASLDRGSSVLPDTSELSARVMDMRDQLSEPPNALQFYHQEDGADLEIDAVESSNVAGIESSDTGLALGEYASTGADPIEDVTLDTTRFESSLADEVPVAAGSVDSNNDFEIEEIDLSAAFIERVSEAVANEDAAQKELTESAEILATPAHDDELDAWFKSAESSPTDAVPETRLDTIEVGSFAPFEPVAPDNEAAPESVPSTLEPVVFREEVTLTLDDQKVEAARVEPEESATQTDSQEEPVTGWRALQSYAPLNVALRDDAAETPSQGPVEFAPNDIATESAEVASDEATTSTEWIDIDALIDSPAETAAPAVDAASDFLSSVADFESTESNNTESSIESVFESAVDADRESLAPVTDVIAVAPAFSSLAIDESQSETERSAASNDHAPSWHGEDLQPEGRLDLPDIDEDLLDIFVLEGNDILDNSDKVMAQLRDAPNDREPISALQRDLHTLKGGARMAGLAPIGDLCHAMESLLDAVHEGHRPMDRPAIEALERGYDRLHALVQRISRRQAIALPQQAIARFERLVSGEVLEDVVVTEDVAQQIESIAEPTVGDASIAPTAASVTPITPVAPRAAQPAEAEDDARPAQEMIRVRSDLLDSLVNYAGEVSIYRSRLEQQISTFRFNLIEFEQTVSRLREQLRKLEIETEAQIIARYQREHHDGTEAVFDPLELDRFSQLQQYSRALGESVSDLVSIQGLLDDLTRQSETLLLQQSRVSSDLQEGLMRTRMVPFDSLVPSLRRTVRQAAQELSKRAQLKVEGAHGEMDRNLLERMKAPFEHMLRNAIAHGIETPDQRLAADKPLDGTVTITVSREATEVVIRVADDGRGMDRDAIRRKAVEQGLLNPDVQLSDRDLYGFIMEAGFSTAEQVTQLAGRGVGMDVVHSEIKQLGGSLVIDSVAGEGTTFTIRLPFTLAVTQAILVKLGDSTYAVPMSSVQGVVRIAHDDYARRINSGNPSYAYGGEEFTIYELSQLLGVPAGRGTDEPQLPLLMTRTGDQRAAVRIDGVVGSREIVVKSVGPQISSVPGIFGATIMGDGSVVMILDLAPLVRRVAAVRASVAAGEIEEPVLPTLIEDLEKPRNPLIMVVDDSITMRKVTTRVLERADMEVLTAKDGLDAVEKLQEAVPDLMLLDIEMPRMDGYELATYMRNDPRLKGVPIIMVTSRTGEKHRQRALEIGVERYLGKPYQEADLLRQVQETLRLQRANA